MQNDYSKYEASTDNSNFRKNNKFMDESMDGKKIL